MAYTELFRINYSDGRSNVEEIYIQGGVLSVADTIKTRLGKPKYVSIQTAPNTATSHTNTNFPVATLSVANRTATVSSVNVNGSPQFLVRFVGV